MSIFWLDGEPQKVPQDKIIPDMFEDRYFLPGIIHGGEDYLIRVYLNDSHGESEGDVDQFDIDYITRDLILKAVKEDPSLDDAFYEALFEAENFCCPNDGSSGDFAKLIDAWPESIYMTRANLVNWADGTYKFYVSDIEWEIDNDLRLTECIKDLYETYTSETGEKVHLPRAAWVTGTDDPNCIADELSDRYGFLVKSFRIKWKKEA